MAPERVLSLMLDLSTKWEQRSRDIRAEADRLRREGFNATAHALDERANAFQACALELAALLGVIVTNGPQKAPQA